MLSRFDPGDLRRNQSVELWMDSPKLSYVTGEVIETTCNNPSYLYLYTRAQYVGYSLDCMYKRDRERRKEK